MAFLLEKNTALNVHLFVLEGEAVWVYFLKLCELVGQRQVGKIGSCENGEDWPCRGFRFCLCSLWQCALAEMISALSSVRWVELLGLIWFTELMKEFDDLGIPCEPHIAVKIHGLLGGERKPWVSLCIFRC